jgi:hypothetical protein
MPEELWKEAVDVARVEGVYSASRALRIEHSRLKKRLASSGFPSRQAPANGDSSGDTDSAFVEVGMSELCGGGKVVLELLGRQGERMRVEVAGTPGVDVVGLTRVFWSHQS